MAVTKSLCWFRLAAVETGGEKNEHFKGKIRNPF